VTARTPSTPNSASDIALLLPGGISVTLPADTPPAKLNEFLVAIAPKGTRESDTTNTPYLTAGEAADYLRFPLKRIYHLTSRGEIPHRKQDGRLLFRRDELDRWLNEFYAGPAGAGPGAAADL
jgi:excisionase family DNA binding protein